MLYESNYYGVSSLGDSLEHHGIKGQKWGVRRFQYEDGLLTPAGRARYDVGPREKTSGGSDYKKGLTRATIEGGLVGRAIYKRKHKAEADAHAESKKQAKEAKRAKKEAVAKAESEFDNYKKGLTRATLETGLVGRALYKRTHKAETDAYAEFKKRLKGDNPETNKPGKQEKLSKSEKKAAAYTKDGKLKVNNTDTSITKGVKKDWNELDDKAFLRKYQTTKKTYAKRVEKYGDPYARVIAKSKKSRAESNVDAKLELRGIERDTNMADIYKKHVSKRIENTGNAMQKATKAYLNGDNAAADSIYEKNNRRNASNKKREDREYRREQDRYLSDTEALRKKKESFKKRK